MALQYYGKDKLRQAPAGRLRALRSCTLAARRARQKPSMLQTLSQSPGEHAVLRTGQRARRRSLYAQQT